MNKRQKKKAFKKKYGYNPPNVELKIEIDWNRVAKECFELGKRCYRTIDYIGKVIIPDMGEQIHQVLNETQKAISATIERIKEMPEEEWEICKKQMTIEQIAIGERIRKRDE